MRVGATRHVSRGEKQCNEDFGRILLFVFAVAIPLGLIYFEWDWKQKNDAYEHVRYNVHGVQDSYVSPAQVGRLIHLTSSKVSPDKELVDVDFAFYGRNSLKMQRVTEYCQWQEFSTDNKDERTGETYRTYYYVKGWHRHQIPSLLFNQPFHHHNPLRDPFPSGEQVAYYAKAGDYFVTRPLLERLGGYRWAYYDQEALSRFQTSPAANLPGGEGFRPIGGGYFYSPYQEGTGSTVARLFGMVLEGSFDFQLGDLFSSCTAGDIRVHYEIIDPTSLSVIGRQIDEKGGVGLYEAANKFQVGIAYSGILTDQELFDKDLWDHWLGLLLGRTLSALFFALFLHLLKGWNLTLVSMSYWGLCLVMGSWVLVRMTDVGSAMLFLQHNPLSAIASASALIFFAYHYNFISDGAKYRPTTVKNDW